MASNILLFFGPPRICLYFMCIPHYGGLPPRGCFPGMAVEGSHVLEFPSCFMARGKHQGR